MQDKLIFPYLDLPIEYYDLGLPYRDETDDQVRPVASQDDAAQQSTPRRGALRTRTVL